MEEHERLQLLLGRCFMVILDLAERAAQAEERAASAEERAVQAEKDRDEQYGQAEDLRSRLDWALRDLGEKARCPKCPTTREWNCPGCGGSWRVN